MRNPRSSLPYIKNKTTRHKRGKPTTDLNQCAYNAMLERNSFETKLLKGTAAPITQRVIYACAPLSRLRI